MGNITSIGWTDSTVNTARGCTKVSPGCINCYWMERVAKMMQVDPTEIHFYDIDKKRKDIKKAGEKIFVNSISDTFHEKIRYETIEQWINLFAEFPDKQFQVLTKRTNRARAFVMYYCAKYDGFTFPTNVWLGTSVEDQGHLFRIRTLQLIPHVRIKFISFEPLLSAIKEPDLKGIDWIIIGGESGDNPRPMKPEWAQDLIDYTRANYPDCAIFFKQMGGKGRDGAGGDILNGKQYKEFPKYK